MNWPDLKHMLIDMAMECEDLGFEIIHSCFGWKIVYIHDFLTKNHKLLA